MSHAAEALRLPNFLIIGAAKAGTTSLYAYLSQHPDVFMSTPKEPSFFAHVGRPPAYKDPISYQRQIVTDADEYRRLFAAAGSRSAIGEASNEYLFCPVAVGEIAAWLEDVRLIAILRDPVDRAYSSYLHLRREGREPSATFQEAVEAAERGDREGWSLLYQYVEAGLYAHQLTRYIEAFGRHRLLILLYDDLVADPLTTVQKVFEFLGVDPTFAPDVTTRYNSGGVPVSQPVHDFLNHPPAWIRRAARRVLPAGLRRQTYVKLHQRNLRAADRLPEASRRWLWPRFSDDVARLEVLLDRDLSAWRGERQR